jgi:metal-responsive CopG/Arc/MetJ family transcriptional regulator
LVKKIAVTLDQKSVAELDRLVERRKRSQLTRELAKLDPAEEKQMAEEGFRNCSWPEH